MIIEDTLRVLFRDVSASAAINRWLNSETLENLEPLCIDFNRKLAQTALMNRTNHYSVDDAEYAFRHTQKFKLEPSMDGLKKFGVFGLLAHAVRDMLTTDVQNECMCKSESLLDFRRLAHPIGPMIFVAAFLAHRDIVYPFQRSTFSWNPIVRSDNDQLQNVLNHGIAENHFHIGGSTDASIFQWVCLMNHISGNRQKDFRKMNLDSQPLDSHPSEEPLFPLVIKAAYIRYFLYCKLQGLFAFESDPVLEDKKISKYMGLPLEDCDQYTRDLDDCTYALRSLCGSGAGENIFVSDYALNGEPPPPLDDNDLSQTRNRALRNYERRLYRPLAGEQRFLYDLFQAIYRQDPTIIPYLDLAYAYLLIYCRFRSELVQVNERVGFKNFLQYQDRKEYFTTSQMEYDALRCRIAQQAVTTNPQVVAFEGRMCPSNTAEKLRDKVKNMLFHATNAEYYSSYVQSLMFISDGKIAESIANLEWEKKNLLSHRFAVPPDLELAIKTLQSAQQKLSYVLHFPKRAQFIKEAEDYPEEEAELFELTHSRDSKMRVEVEKQANAIIHARSKYPQIMSWVTAIDACSSEIDCRPEVFAPQFRRMTQSIMTHEQPYDESYSVPPLRITYHAGEDFLDPIDGLRAIDEAIEYLEMKSGDRLGHALALGIDCEAWYVFKGNSVLLQKQALLDNLVWLYGNMLKYNIPDTEVETHIRKWFKKLFKSIYVDNLNQDKDGSILYNIDIEDYFSSMALRGNDPLAYVHNPDGSQAEKMHFKDDLDATKDDTWRVRDKAGRGYDTVSNMLYHCYHWNSAMKQESSKIIEYKVPQCIVRAVSRVQEKMQYHIALCGIGIECNPSSNYLIGTFRDYIKHPIFRFDNQYLYSISHPNGQNNNPHIKASINTDDLGIFDTSLENEYALMASALHANNQFCLPEERILPQQIYEWLDHIRQNGCEQNFKIKS